MMSGPIRPASDEMMTATQAMVTLLRSVAMSGSKRTSAAMMPGCSALGGALLSAYELVLAGTALGVINLRVLRRGLKQLFVHTRCEGRTLHQQNNLIVVGDRCDLLCHREERRPGIVAVHVLEDGTRGRRVDASREVVEQQDPRVERKRA